MKPDHPAWNWTLLLLLGFCSYMVGSSYGFVGPFFFTTFTPDSPPPYTPTVYPWAGGLAFSALTAIVFLFCLRDQHQRRAAFAAFGISALLTGPLYVVNANRLAEFAPANSPWMPPHIPFGLTVLCWIFSAGLMGWWLFRFPSGSRQSQIPLFLFGGLFLVLLIIPAITIRCGIESLYFFTILPTNADGYQNNQAALTHLLVFGFAGALGDIVAFMIQWIGIIGSIVLVPIFLCSLHSIYFRSGRDRISTDIFPNRSDLMAVLFLAVGGILFSIISSLFDGLIRQTNEVAHTLQRPVYACQGGLFSIEILVELIFLAGSWFILRRIRGAPQLRFGFSLLILVASLSVSIIGILAAPGAMKVGGILALFLCIGQWWVFFNSDKRTVWVASEFGSPSGIALSFATMGGILLTILASAFMAVALELAMVSVLAIHYLMDWGSALKLPHGVAPTEKIVPAFAPTMAAIHVDLGPVYFAACLFLGVVIVLIFSLVYTGCQGVGKLYRLMRGSRCHADTLPPNLSSERCLGDVTT